MTLNESDYAKMTCAICNVGLSIRPSMFAYIISKVAFEIYVVGYYFLTFEINFYANYIFFHISDLEANYIFYQLCRK